MAFSPDGTLLAIARPAALLNKEYAGSVLLVDASHWKLIATIESPDATFYGGSDPASLAFSADSKLLAVAWDSSVNVYEPNTGGELKQFEKDAKLSAAVELTRNLDFNYGVRFDDYLVAFGQGNRQLVAVDSEGGIHAWDLSTGRESVHKVKPHQRLVMGVSPTGKIAFESSDQIHLWNIATRARVRSIALPNSEKRIYHLKASPDGKILAADMDYVVPLWSLADGNPLQPIGEEPPKPLQPPKTILGKLIRYCFGSTRPDRSTHYNLFLEFCGSKPWLATGGTQGEIIVWDIKTGKQIGRFDAPGHEVEAITFSHDGKLLVAAYRERTLLWNLGHLQVDQQEPPW